MPNERIELIYHLVCYFFIYGLLGWLWETCLCSLRARRFVNRGLLIGPICPIYGLGMGIMLVFLYPLSSNPFLLFFGGLLICGAIEYITSWAIEVTFRAILWDYSRQRYNINYRICPQISVFWGVISVVMMRFVHPFFRELVQVIPVNIGYIVVFCLMALFLIDFVIAVVGIVNFREKLERMRAIHETFQDLLQSSNVFESAREWMLLVDINSDYSALDAIRRLGSRVVTSGRIVEEELSANLAMLKVRYRKSSMLGFVHRRLLRSFPKARFRGYTKCMDDIRDMLD